MEEQDETLTKYCSDAMQVKMCHARCGHDGNCHRECPLPKDADLKAKVMENMECHAKCGDDHACHHECHHSGGSSFREVHEKCRMMDFEEQALLARGGSRQCSLFLMHWFCCDPAFGRL